MGVDGDGLVQKVVALLERVAGDEFEELECPDCGRPSVSAWFTHLPGMYRTWLIYTACGFETSAGGSRPSNFDEARVHPELQARYERLAADMRFPPEPDDPV